MPEESSVRIRREQESKRKTGSRVRVMWSFAKPALPLQAEASNQGNLSARSDCSRERQRRAKRSKMRVEFVSGSRQLDVRRAREDTRLEFEFYIRVSRDHTETHEHEHGEQE